MTESIHAHTKSKIFAAIEKKKRIYISPTSLSFPDSSVGKEYTCNAGDPDSISGLGRSAR